MFKTAGDWGKGAINACYFRGGGGGKLVRERRIEEGFYETCKSRRGGWGGGREEIQHTMGYNADGGYIDMIQQVVGGTLAVAITAGSITPKDCKGYTGTSGQDRIHLEAGTHHRDTISSSEYSCTP